jgi:RHS repeat-associated protein
VLRDHPDRLHSRLGPGGPVDEHLRLNLVRETGSATADYLLGPGIDEPLAMSRSGSTYYYVVDGLGSVTEVTDISAAVQDTYLYDALGQTRTSTGTLANPVRYTAQEAGEAGTLYYRARYLLPSIGRFFLEDPLGVLSPSATGLDVDPCSYAGSDPVLNTDPDGLFTRGPKVPPINPTMSRFLICVESCINTDLLVTATTNGTHGDPGHKGGASVDVRPPGVPSKRVFCCAAKCGSQYTLDERKPGTTKFQEGANYHFQLVPPVSVPPRLPNDGPFCPNTDC